MQLHAALESSWKTAIALTKYVFDGYFWKPFFSKRASIDWVLTGPWKYWNLKSVLENLENVLGFYTNLSDEFSFPSRS